MTELSAIQYFAAVIRRATKDFFAPIAALLGAFRLLRLAWPDMGRSPAKTSDGAVAVGCDAPPAPRLVRDLKSIYIVDSHEHFSEGLALAVHQFAKTVNVQIFSAWAPAAEQLASATQTPDIIFLDIASVRELHRAIAEARDVSVIALSSGIEESSMIRACVDAGAMGFVPKSSAVAQIFDAIQIVLSGGVYLPPPQQLMQIDVDSELRGLTPRELEVFLRLVQGKSNRVIAREIGIPESKVKSLVASLLDSMNARNRAELFRIGKKRLF